MGNHRPLAQLAGLETLIDRERRTGATYGVVREGQRHGMPRSRKRATAQLHVLREQREMIRRQAELVTGMYFKNVTEKLALEAAVKRLTNDPQHVLSNIAFENGRATAREHALAIVARQVRVWRETMRRCPEESGEWALAAAMVRTLLTLHGEMERALTCRIPVTSPTATRSSRQGC